MSDTFESVPAEATDREQWVNWRYVPNPSNPKKPKKKPINPRTGKAASVKNPDTWASFERAAKSLNKGEVDGIGFVFTEEDTIVGIDLDNCRDAKTGKIEQWAQDILDEIVSYSEVSPSGTGVHILAKGKLSDKGTAY